MRSLTVDICPPCLLHLRGRKNAKAEAGGPYHTELAPLNFDTVIDSPAK